MALTDNLSCLQPTKNICDVVGGTGATLQEMQTIYQETLPYLLNEMVGGFCIIWEPSFLRLCRYAMSTDCMDTMSSPEREVWRYLTRFEDNHTTSAYDYQCDGKAAGATDYMDYTDEDTGTEYKNISFPVALHTIKLGAYRLLDPNTGNFRWALIDDINDVPVFCINEIAAEPLFDVPKEYVYDDLDEIFYNIHECLPYNDCGCSEFQPIQVNDCPEYFNCDEYGDCDEDIFKTSCTGEICPVPQP